MASLSVLWANLGMISETWIPGTFVSIGWNGPRIASLASGLGSHRSRWLGPPQLKMRITERALPLRPGALAAARNHPAQKAPQAPPAAARNDLREAASEPGFRGGRNFGIIGLVTCVLAVSAGSPTHPRLLMYRHNTPSGLQGA